MTLHPRADLYLSLRGDGRRGAMFDLPHFKAAMPGWNFCTFLVRTQINCASQHSVP